LFRPPRHQAAEPARALTNISVAVLSIAAVLVVLGWCEVRVADGAPSRPRHAASKHKAALKLRITFRRHWITARIWTKPGAWCKLGISTRRKSASLPKHRANKSGKATFAWGVPLNAPSGRWTFSVRCTRAGRTYRLKRRATILTGGNGKDALVEWSSLTPQTPGKGAGAPVVRVSVPDKRGAADPGDDYPGELKNRRQDSVQDQWGELNRECTSFVAWALATRNRFDMPFYDDATAWGPRARSRGFKVNSSPAKGAVAWSPSGHVAYVQDVVGSQVHIEEYNHGYPKNPGKYSSRTVAASNFQYIHFADLSGPKGPRSPGWNVAFHSSDGELWTLEPGGGTDWHLGLASGTSPSITGLDGGDWAAAFQSDAGELWTLGPGGGMDWHLGLAPGTSPSITGLDGGSWAATFQSNDGELWTLGPGGGTDWHLGVRPGTSPSITSLDGGSWAASFQSNDGELWTLGPGGGTDWHLGVRPGTSPSITSLDGGSWAASFQSNDGELWTLGPGGGTDWHLGVRPGTSPSITRLDGASWAATFQSNAGELWTLGPGGGTDWHLGVRPGTSPSITSLDGGSWAASFQSNDAELWTLGPGGGTDWHLGVRAGTSPAITR
jgi:surface antigen